MALILDSLYDALKAAGASEEQARAAARDLADHDGRLNRMEREIAVLKWLVGAALALALGVLWMQWLTIERLAGIDGRLAIIEARLSGS